ncbi:class I SAM-dependent methyltransferase [bacterium]|nr:MAG: class I SAM-dependent methyltransferase [bacterium]
MRSLLRWLWFNWIYFRQAPWDTRTSPPELVQFMDAHAPGRALDLGCGTGTNLLTMASYGWQVTGVEYAWRAVLIARRRLKQARVNGVLIAGDVTRAKLANGAFDLILDMGCYHGLATGSRAAYRANLLRWLAPGGTFLLYAHCQGAGGGAGIEEGEIEKFSTMLRLAERLDSYDSRERKAVWLRLERCV